MKADNMRTKNRLIPVHANLTDDIQFSIALILKRRAVHAFYILTRL